MEEGLRKPATVESAVMVDLVRETGDTGAGAGAGCSHQEAQAGEEAG